MKISISIFSDVPKHFQLRGGGASIIWPCTVAKKNGHGKHYSQLFCNTVDFLANFLAVSNMLGNVTPQQHPYKNIAVCCASKLTGCYKL